MSFYERAVVALRDVVREPPLLEPLRERPLLEPPREPAAERLAEVDAAFAPERAPVAAALVARRAPDAALRAVLRAEVVRLDELLRLDEPPRDRDELELLDGDVDRVRVRLGDALERLRLDERRLRPVCARWSRGISFLTRSLTSCGISRSR
jgi:hypothetical protein